MTFLDTFLVISILAFLALIIWSRVQQQNMLDTLNEIKEFIGGLKNG